jgi:hypothetical protein
MRTLIFPDLHQPTEICIDAIENLITREAPDCTVFLGDYFDRFGDTPADAARTAQWLTTSLSRKDRVHIVGNHDASYFWPSRATMCPGWSPEKQVAFDSVFGRDPDVPSKFTFFIFVQGWLLTHAGLANIWVPREAGPDLSAFPTIDALRAYQESWVPREPDLDLSAWLTRESLHATAAFTSGQPHWFAAIGYLRGGELPAGGILWCDWREKRYPVKQLCGHTPSRWVRRDGIGSVCLDTNVRNGVESYAIITDGALKTFDLPLPKLPR